MPHRVFNDAAGIAWEVWDVHVPGRDSEAQSGGQLVAKWLIFRSKTGKWRLTPVPEGWEQLSDVGLHALHFDAAPVRDEE